MNQTIPSLGFGWLRRGNEICVGYSFLISIDNIADDDYLKLLILFQREGLECLDISNDLEYQNALGAENGIAIYVKKHNKDDVDFYSDSECELTVYKIFLKVVNIIENVYSRPIKLKSNAENKLLWFQRLFTDEGIEWETIKLIMPEMSDIDDLYLFLSQKQVK